MKALHSRREAGAIKALLPLILVVAVAVAGYAGYRWMTNRTGEAAIAYIPADADIVITLDTAPSPEQVAAFQEIGEAMRASGNDVQLANLIGEGLGKTGLVADIRPHLENSFAWAMWMPKNDSDGESNNALFLAVKDTAAVEKALAGLGSPTDVRGLKAYPMPNKDGFMALAGQYLVLVQKTQTLERIADVRDGKSQGVSSLPEYQSARRSLPDDANLMVFMSPAGLKTMKTMDPSLAKSLDVTKWMAFSTTLRRGGLQMDYYAPVNLTAVKGVEQIADTKPVDPKLFDRLPSGAYGVMVYSNVQSYYAYMDEAMKTEPEVHKSMREGIAQLEKETGLSFENDVLPAFKGHMVLAVYPGASGRPEDLEMIFLVDDANGGNPTALAQKGKGLLEKIAANEGEKLPLVERTVDGATIYALDENASESFRKTLGDGVPEEALKDKSPTYALANGTFVMASSPRMLTMSLEALKGNGALSADPAYSTVLPQLDAKAQGLILINLKGIMETMRPILEKELENEPRIKLDDVINLFGDKAALMTISGHMDRETSGGRMFLPVDWARAGNIVKAMESKPQPTPQP